MIRQKIVTQCSLIRLPGFPDNTVINYVFCPNVLSQKIQGGFFFSFPGLYFFSLFPHPPGKKKINQTTITKKTYQKPSLMSYYCNPSLIKSTDRLGGVLYGRPISMLSAHLTAPAASCCCF